MIEALRAIRVGAVNLFGIAIPGFLILFVSFGGFVIPLLMLAWIGGGAELPVLVTVYNSNEALVWMLVVVFSYVAGYILRLSSPDDLDEVSGRKVLTKMKPKEREVWPYTGDEEDK